MKERLNQNLLKMTYYQKSLELFDLTWKDCDQLQKDRKAWSISDQIIRSCGSITANIEEGYGRESTKEYLRFLRIARGSALETQGWYYKSKYTLGEAICIHRMKVLDEIIGKISAAISSLKKKL
jgi:four helix bundle protein